MMLKASKFIDLYFNACNITMKAFSFLMLFLFVVSCNNSSEKVFIDQRDKKEYTYFEYGREDLDVGRTKIPGR